MDPSSTELKPHEIAFKTHAKYTQTPDIQWDHALRMSSLQVSEWLG